MTDEAPTVTATAPPGGSATATTSPALAVTKTIEHNEASALPETGWFWRRLFIFAVSAALIYLIHRTLDRATDMPTVRLIARGLLILLGLSMLLYIAGASTEAITRLVGAVKTTRRETVTETPTTPHDPTAPTEPNP